MHLVPLKYETTVYFYSTLLFFIQALFLLFLLNYSYLPLMVLLTETLVLFQNDQSLQDGLIWEEFICTQFSSITCSDSDRSLMGLELYGISTNSGKGAWSR
jgi:hypothetical protein